MNESDTDILVGLVGPTFGLRGEVKVRLYTDHPEQFAKGSEVQLTGLPEGIRVLKIATVREHKGALIVKFAGIDDISAAETLRNAEIRVPAEDLVPLDENEYYIDDLIGLDVVTTDGKSLGHIEEVLRSPANDIYVTDKAMIPALKEFILRIDLDKRKVVVRLVEGMMQKETNEG